MSRFRRSRRRFRGRRRFGRRRARRGGRRFASKVYWFRHNWDYTIDAPVSGNTAHWFTFGLANLSDISRYTNLFDEYRIAKVVLKVIPRVTSYTDVAPSNTTTIRSIIDYTNNPGISTITQFNDYATYKETRNNRVHTRILRPRVAAPIFQGSALPFAYAPQRSGWLGTAYDSVPHYGVYVLFPGGPTVYDVKVTYYIAWRHVDSTGAAEDVPSTPGTEIENEVINDALDFNDEAGAQSAPPSPAVQEEMMQGEG